MTVEARSDSYEGRMHTLVLNDEVHALLDGKEFTWKSGMNALQSTSTATIDGSWASFVEQRELDVQTECNTFL